MKNIPPKLNDSQHSLAQLADASDELARVEQQTEQARAQLARLLKELETAQSRQIQTQEARLLEANEQLVLATLNAQKAADISQRALREAMEAAQLDALTELPNRLLLRARLALAIAEARQRGGRVALLLLEISNFMQIHDSLGAAVGDQVLRHAAQCLTDCVTNAAGPQATVSRHGSIEFLVLLPDVQQISFVSDLIGQIMAALGAPARFNDHVLRLHANVGTSIYPEDSEHVDSLIHHAMADMYRIKWQSPDNDTDADIDAMLDIAVKRTGNHGDKEAGSGSALALHRLHSMQQPVVQRTTALAEQIEHLADVQKANTELLVAALGARGLAEAAEHARSQQAMFLGILAHELRHPLAPLRNAAALLGRIPSAEPLLAKVQAIIERQLSTMSRLVGDLLDLSRADTGKLRIEKHPVDLLELIDQVVSACRPGMDTHLQRFDVRLPLHRVELQGDAVRLTQVFTNLLDNASKYTPEGGKISLSVQIAEGDWLVITVTDNGIGITPETLPNIFEPFVQDAHAAVFDKTGLGIGLTVVRNLVEAHGGEVTARSAGKMRGSVFTVRLPLGADVSSAEAEKTNTNNKKSF
jgi:diguanylate cyclase